MASRVSFLLVLLSCVCILPSGAQTLVTSIPVNGTAYGVAVNSNNNRIYVALDTASGPAVDVIDGSTNTVIDTIYTSQGSSFVAVNISNDRVYTAGCDNTQTPACGVTVIDGTSDEVIAIVPIDGSPNGIGPQGISIDPVTNRIYVSDDLNYQLEEINGLTNTATYMKDGNLELLGLAADFGTGQVLGVSGDNLDIFNPTTHAISSVRLGKSEADNFWDVAVNPFTSRAYVTNDSGTLNTLPVVNLDSRKIIANIPVGTGAYGVCVDYLSNRVFVAVQNTYGTSNVTEINGQTNTVVGTVNVFAQYLDVNPVTRLVYASGNFLTNQVNVISE
jgi:DNA-binding beta-propeller fold protein YncE